MLVWNKGLTSKDLRAYRIASLYKNFEDQIAYLPVEYQDVARGFRDLLFEDGKRKKCDINTVINFVCTERVWNDLSLL